jgi:hypothetical protein
MRWLPPVAFVLGCCTLVQAQSQNNNWPIPGARPQVTVPDRPDLAPDLANAELPINHAQLIWFVSARELPRQGVEPIDRIQLGRLLDADWATSTLFAKPRKYEIVFDLQRTVVVDRVAFTSDVPGCPVSVRVSGADLSQDQGKGWRDLGTAVTTVPITKFAFRFEPIRFIHFTIDTTKAPAGEPLNIYEFCVFGQEDIRDYVLKQLPDKEQVAREQFVRSSPIGNFPKEMLQCDLASLHSGASIRQLGPEATDPKISYAIDDDPETSWKMNPAQKDTIVLLDLGQTRMVRKVSVMHSARPGKVLVYGAENLPGQKAKPAQLAWLDAMTDVPLLRLAQNAPNPPAAEGPPVVSPEWLASQKPIGTFDSGATNYSSLDVEDQNARFLIFCYQSTVTGGEPLLINGINVLGDYTVGEFVLMPRLLPIIAGAGYNMGAPLSGDNGVPLEEQINDTLKEPIAPPKPTPATP